MNGTPRSRSAVETGAAPDAADDRSVDSVDMGRRSGPLSDAAGDDASVRRILVAMSGGVDSSVAAALLQEQGWEVAGVTFKLFCYGEAGKETRACCGLEGVRDAQSVARRLGIPHTVLDMVDLFRERVLDDFANEYGRGRTPNPCVQCNTHVKFGPLLSWARRHGYGWVATGHYVRRVTQSVDGRERVLLARPRDAGKDQSYVLWGVPPEVLGRTLFPLGELGKAQVREKAKALGFPVWDKEESQDICFVDDRGYVEVLRERLGPGHALFQSGEIVDQEGRTRGRHPGLVHFTVGQRRGIGLTSPEPLHVTRLDTERNELVVGDAADLLREELVAEDVNLFVSEEELFAAPVEVKIRYRHEPASARIERAREGTIRIRFDEPQRAVAPGQSCVLYRDGMVLGGGRIGDAGPAGCGKTPRPGAQTRGDEFPVVS
jgi:tRNA-specific 2-thiouridylase